MDRILSIGVFCALAGAALLAAAPLAAQVPSQAGRPAIPPSRSARQPPPPDPAPAVSAAAADSVAATPAGSSSRPGTDSGPGAAAPSGSGVEPFRLPRSSLGDPPAPRPSDQPPPSTELPPPAEQRAPVAADAPATPRAGATAPPSPARPSTSTVIILRGGTIEAEARLLGQGVSDAVGTTSPPSSDGRPDTEIELKLDAAGFLLDWIEVRSAPDPTELLWTTRGGRGSRPLGLVQGGRLLNDARGGVAGIAIDDFVVLILYVQDDGLLERLDPPGTITIGFQGGDVATIPMAP